MDTFNIISGLITITSFIFAFVLHLNEKGLRQRLESGLLILISSMDKISAMEEESKYKKLHMGVAAAATRDHAIALLKSFSDKEERIKTWDMGITDEAIEERIRKRRMAHGISYGGCVITGQEVTIRTGKKLIEDIVKNDSIRCVGGRYNDLYTGTCKSTKIFDVPNYVEINGSLKVTANHQVYCREFGWIEATDIKIGYELRNDSMKWDIVSCIRLVDQPSKAVAMSTTAGNYFVSGYLVHNEEK